DVVEENQVVQTLAHCGLTVTYESTNESIDRLVQTEEGTDFGVPANLEYTLTSVIHKMSRTTRPIVAMVSEKRAPQFDPFMGQRGGGEDRFSLLASQVMEKQFGNDLRRSVNLDDPVPADVTVMLVVAPKDWT